MAKPLVKLIAGLGNPGKKYEKTPHNVGFAVIDEIAKRLDCPTKRSLRYKAWIGKSVFSDDSLFLMKPATYMNRSGIAVQRVMNKNGVPANNLIAVFDDVNLELGKIRIRKKGSAGGHNGVKSLIENIGSDEFVRIRLGIGKGRSPDLTGHVLGRFTQRSWQEALKMINRAADAAVYILEQGVEKAMNEFNPDTGS